MDVRQSMNQGILVNHSKSLTIDWAQRIARRWHDQIIIKHLAIQSIDVGTTTRIRLLVDYDGPQTLAKHWFVKIPSLARRARIITALPRLLPTEVRFYQQIARQIPVQLTGCLAAESKLGRGSTLVLVDVAESGYYPGQTSDALNSDQARIVVEQLASMHAQFWQRIDTPAYHWLAGPVRNLEDRLGSALAVPLMSRGLRLAGSSVPSALHKPAYRYAQQRRLAMNFLHDAPLTLTHHDCHPGNLFWNQNLSAVGFLDWQLVRIGEGIGDIAYFLSTALDPKIRRTEEKHLLNHYVKNLIASGIGDINQEHLNQRYRAHLVYALEAMLVTLAVGGMMNLEDNLELIHRAATAVHDWDAYSALPL